MTGRIVISSPDEDNLSLVAGEDNSVSASAIVLAVNENRVSIAWELLDRLIPNVLAQNFPSRCSRAGHACAQADENGAFDLEIEATEEDEISISEIDATQGTDLADPIKKPVPRNFIHFAYPPIDVAIAPISQMAYVLLPIPNENGRVVRVNLATKERTLFPLSSAHPIRILMNSSENRLLILDDNDNSVSIVDPILNNFNSPTKVILPASPVDVVFESAGQLAWVTLNQAAHAIAIIDIIEGSLVSTIALPVLQSFVHQNSIEITRSENLDGDELIAIFSKYRNTTTNVDHMAVTIFDAFSQTVTNGPRILGIGTILRDIVFINQAAHFLISDPLRNVIEKVTIPSDNIQPVSATDITAVAINSIVTPRFIAISTDNELAFVTARNGGIDRPDTVLTIDLNTLAVIDITPVGLNPGRLVWDELNDELFVVSSISRSATRLPLSTLLPNNPDLF